MLKRSVPTGLRCAVASTNVLLTETIYCYCIVSFVDLQSNHADFHILIKHAYHKVWIISIDCCIYSWLILVGSHIFLWLASSKYGSSQ